MKAGDKVRLIGMIGTPPDANIDSVHKEYFDARMVTRFTAVGVAIGDEGTIICTFTGGWADVKFPQREIPIGTPQANLEVLEEDADFEVDMVIHRMDPVDPGFEVHNIVG